MDKPRCPWPATDPLMIAYHDTEWGVPVHDGQKIYEFLVLETFQAGLSWRTVLHKRENFRKAFHGFDVAKVARMDARATQSLLGDAGIIRNRQKIAAAVNNAQRFLEVQKEFGTFSKYMWTWVGGKAVRHAFKTPGECPVTTDEAVVWSKDLKKRGFSFLGPTVVYAHMQAVGMVNDHLVSCFRYAR
ncbi:DNA-3-methyladenine glycosylase I [Patescibacteria group bacterium]|nr:MAG: DNA-3-methyladenine glycosylase I [Patescibacteria group bacterium]